jgi:hypothetical protein
MWELQEVYVPVSKCSPDFSPIMSILTYTAKRLLPGMRFPLSSYCDPLSPARAVLLAQLHAEQLLLSLPGTGMPMSSSVVPHVSLEDLLTRAYAFQRRGLPQEKPAKHINLKI